MINKRKVPEGYFTRREFIEGQSAIKVYENTRGDCIGSFFLCSNKKELTPYGMVDEIYEVVRLYESFKKIEVF